MVLIFRCRDTKDIQKRFIQPTSMDEYFKMIKDESDKLKHYELLDIIQCWSHINKF